LPSSGVSSGTYGSATSYPVFTVDDYGIITSASEQGAFASWTASDSSNSFNVTRTSSQVDFTSYDGSLIIDASASGTIDFSVDGESDSDARLKENVVPLSDSVAVLKKLRPVSFEWNQTAKDQGKKEGTEAGLIAQDVEKVLPHLVGEKKNGFKTVDYAKITPLLIDAVQTLTAEVEQLRDRIEDLEHSQQ